MAHPLRVLGALAERLPGLGPQNLHKGSQLPVMPVPGVITPSSGLSGHCIHTVHLPQWPQLHSSAMRTAQGYAGKTLVIKYKPINLKRNALFEMSHAILPLISFSWGPWDHISTAPCLVQV